MASNVDAEVKVSYSTSSATDATRYCVAPLTPFHARPTLPDPAAPTNACSPDGCAGRPGRHTGRTASQMPSAPHTTGPVFIAVKPAAVLHVNVHAALPAVHDDEETPVTSSGGQLGNVSVKTSLTTTSPSAVAVEPPKTTTPLDAPSSVTPA